MAISIVVETGSGDNPAANSYATKAEAVEYAANRGTDLSGAAADVIEAMLIKGMDYLLLYSERWKGDPVQPGVQPLDWPRTNVWIETYNVPDTEIPNMLKRALCQLVIEQHNGLVLLPSSEPGLPIVKEKIDVIETEYASPASIQGRDFSQPDFPQVDILLAKLLRDDGFSLRTVRI